MKKLYLLLFFIPLISLGQVNKPLAKINDFKTVKVIIYREKSPVWRQKRIQVELNNEPLTTLLNGSYVSYEMRAQECRFRLAVNPPAEADIKLYSDEIYYLRIRLSEDKGQIFPSLEFVDKDSAIMYFDKHRLAKLGKRNLVKDSINMEKVKWNISGSNVLAFSADMGSGFGFYNVPMVTLTDSSEATISAGGGSIFGLSAIYRFNPYLDIQGEFQTQNGSLVPYVENATVTFNRIALSLTVRFTAQLSKRWRWSIGPGIAGFQNVNMKTDFKKLPNGYYGVFKYKPSTGFIINGESEYYFKAFSIALGAKYSSNTYSLKSIDIDGVKVPVNGPGFDDVRSMDGSSLFFYWGFRYHL